MDTLWPKSEYPLWRSVRIAQTVFFFRSIGVGPALNEAEVLLRLKVQSSRQLEPALPLLTCPKMTLQENPRVGLLTIQLRIVDSL